MNLRLYAGYSEMGLVPQSFRLLIRKAEERVAEAVEGYGTKRAVFDLDGTLIKGDIGAAVLAVLLQQGAMTGMSWSRYRWLESVNPERAYRAAVEAMSGISYEAVVEATLHAMVQREPVLLSGKVAVQLPEPVPVMRGLVAYLHSQGYAVHVITASNHISATVLCGEWFGIPPERVFGIRQVIDASTLSPFLVGPVPVGDGKALTYRQFIGQVPPVLAASDSLMDLPLLALTASGGIALWAGSDENALRSLQRSLPRRIDIRSLKDLTSRVDTPPRRHVA